MAPVETTAPSLTTTSIDAECPSIVAVIVAVPSATPVTTPAATLIFDGSELDHVVRRSVRLLPAASLGVATMTSVPFGTSSMDAGDRTTGETGAGGAVDSPQPIPNAINPAAARRKTRILSFGIERKWAKAGA